MNSISAMPLQSTPSPIDTDDVIDRVQRMIEAGAITQSRVAKESGVSAGVLNPLLKGAYPGNVAAQVEKLRTWLESYEQRGQLGGMIPALPEFIEMPTATRILEAVEYAHLFSSITLVYGAAGMTKTSSLKEYQRRKPNKVWYLRVTVDCGPVQIFLEELAMALGCDDGSRHSSRLRRSLVRKLEGSKGLLMIDEAQHLTENALEAARDLHDLTGVGLVLAGNAHVYDQLYGARVKGDDFAQFASRVGKRVPLTSPAAGDVASIARAFGITDAGCLTYLQRLAQRKGALRNVVQTLRLAAVFASGAGAALALDHIKLAWADLQAAGGPGGSEG